MLCWLEGEDWSDRDAGAVLHLERGGPLRGVCRAEKGRGPQAQLCLENSSPDIYDYDGPSLVDLLWNINKLNRLQIIVTTELNPRLWSRAMDVSFCLSVSPLSDSI